MKPPRALWVSFELGRPLGIPNDATFQTRVVLAALRLFNASEGPVLEDFPEDAVTVDGEDVIWACPVDLSKAREDLTGTEQLCEGLKKEFTALRPWYDQSVRTRGRTTVGVSGIDLDGICDFICSFLDGESPENPREDLPLAFVLNFAVDDLKAFYSEAVAAQPGDATPGSETLADWFWEDTIAAKVIFSVKESCGNSSDGMMKAVCNMLLIPAAQATRMT